MRHCSESLQGIVALSSGQKTPLPYIGLARGADRTAELPITPVIRRSRERGSEWIVAAAEVGQV